MYYACILFGKNCIFKHKILDFTELKSLPRFHHTIEQIELVFLKNFLCFNHCWNHEVILQFCATLYVPGDLANSNTWILEWMTGEEKIKCLVDQFLALLNLPQCEFDMAREHRLHYWDVFEAQLHLLMDPKLVGDECIEANPKNLLMRTKCCFISSATPSRQQTCQIPLMASWAMLF